MNDRRLIEETFPVREVSQHAAKEKNIRHGHISTLHIWWARRPLAASRATAYAALVPPAPAGDDLAWQRENDFVADLSRWENALTPQVLERARRAIYAVHAERLSGERGEPVTVADIEAGRVPSPRVLDPFAGGGSYPLEALRLGCEAHAGDYNPVAVLLLKATLEYPQRYGRPFAGMPEHLLPRRRGGRPREQGQLSLGLGEPEEQALPPDLNPLLAAVKYWGEWVLEKAREELAAFYPPAEEGETVVGYIWARTLPCQNPTCGVEVPLMRQFWLAKKKGRRIALRPVVHGPGQPVEFEIVARGDKVGVVAGRSPDVAAGARPATLYQPWPAGFDPSRGTVRRAVVVCPACGSSIPATETRRLFRAAGANGRSPAGQRMVAVVCTREGQRGKFYRRPTPADLEAFRAAETALAEKQAALRTAWGLEPVPDEPLPPRGTLGFRVQGYAIETWGDLFNPRQQLALLTFTDAVRHAHRQMLARGYPEGFARAVVTYLGLGGDMAAAFSNVLARWENTSEAIKQLFSRQALPMLWDYAETNLFSRSSGSFETGQGYYCKVIEHLSQFPSLPRAREVHGTGVTHTSAT